MTKRSDGRLLLKPYKNGDKNQLFKLERDTSKYLFCIYFKDYESDLVATIGNKGELILEPQVPASQAQLWYTRTEEYFDMVYVLQDPSPSLALMIGDEMGKLNNDTKAMLYYERSFELAPDNYVLCDLWRSLYEIQ